MADYAAPLDDMRFVLDNIVDLKALTALPEFAHADAELVDAVLGECAKLSGEVIGPLNATGDREGSKWENGVVRQPKGFADAYRQFRDGGWNGVPFAADLGGAGLPWAVSMATQEMITSANMAFSLCPLLTQGAIEAVQAHASDALKAIYLEKMVSGEWTGTMNLTEPQAGSDVGALRTKAVAVGDGTYRITGQKIFITYGEHDMADNIVHLVLARLPDAPPGTKGISLFLVPKYFVNADGSLGTHNDLRCVSIEHKLGIHASPTCVMSYGDNGGAVGWLIGEENKGMRCMFTMMNSARLSVGLQGLSIAERAYQQALQYAQDRKQGRGFKSAPTSDEAIIVHADVRRNLMLMKSQIEALRCLIYVNAESLDFAHHHSDPETRAWRSDLAELLTPLSKAWGTDLGVELTSIGVQIHGGMGFIEETGAAQHFRDARIAPIYEGTNGIQAADLVGRKLPMKGGQVVERYLTEIAATIAELKAGGAAFADIAAALETALGQLRSATTAVAAALASDPDRAMAASVAYLRMFAVTAGGHYLGQSALKAEAARAGGDDRPLLARKLLTAKFYAAQVLPQVGANLPAVVDGAALMAAVTPEFLAG